MTSSDDLRAAQGATWQSRFITTLAEAMVDVSSPDYPMPSGSDDWDDLECARWLAGEVSRAALPIIREGIAQEIEAARPEIDAEEQTGRTIQMIKRQFFDEAAAVARGVQR